MLQLIQFTPEQFKELILEVIKREFEELKKNYQPKEPSVYMTRNEVSKMLSIDLSTVHNWCKSGKLNPHYLGNRVYFKRDEVEASFKTND